MLANHGISTISHPRTLLLAIHAPYNKTKNIEAYYEEFLHLISSNGIVYEDVLYIKLRAIDTGYFITSGKVEELRELCEKKQIEQVIISEILSPQQERNLSEILNCHVYDRTQLILEIFEKSAHSAEGKLQVAIAMFQHQKSRVAGRGASFGQQAGHIGNRGPGETAKERDLQYFEDQINRHKKQLRNLEQVRDTQRKRRLENKVPHVCLIGYTNAGKSTILNQLTKANVLAEDKLFATLDTTTRELYVDGIKGVISDTVGFIQQLPTKLIDAFKSTLAELAHADLLLHVIDAANEEWEHHIKVVNAILKDLEIKKDILYVFNKIDRVDAVAFGHACEQYEPQVLIDATSKEGIAPLLTFLKTWNKK